MTIIPQGYKETEIGVLPNDWDIKSYGELFYFLNTATYSRAELSDDSDIDYVHYGDIHTKCNYHVDFTKMIIPCITSDKLKKYPLLEIGDLIMADASEDYEGIGKSVEILNIGKKSISGLHTFLLRNKSNSLALGFKGYIHANQYVRNQFNSLATGMKVYGVSKGNLRSILIPIPTLPEQTAIANALRDIDDLINTTQALITKKKAIKTATMQQLLTPKEDWVEMRLGDVGDVKMCKRIFSHQTLPYGEIPFYKIGTFGKEPDAFITRQKFDTFKSKFSYPNIGDILISAAGTIGRTVIYNGDEAYFQDSNIVWIENDNTKVLNAFLIYIYKIVNFNTEGGTIQRLYNSILKSAIFICPPISEQKVIIEKMATLDSLIQNLESTLTKYQSIKQGMMQNLLTGNIRLI